MHIQVLDSAYLSLLTARVSKHNNYIYIINNVNMTNITTEKKLKWYLKDFKQEKEEISRKELVL